MATIVVPIGSVDCGGHAAASCASCPGEHGSIWCNGDCMWVGGMLGAGKCEMRSFVAGLPDPDAADANTDLLYWVTLLGLAALVMLIYAMVYKRKVVAEIGELPKTMNIVSNELSLFVCFTKLHAFLHTAFCMPIVLGKNYKAARVMEFWPGCIFSFLLTYTPLLPVGICVRAILAKKVQDSLGHETSFVPVLLRNIFCMPCDVGRESEEVDDELGAEIRCCFKVSVTPRLLNEADDAKKRMCNDGWGKNRMCVGS